jgi:hypothetical protein
MIWAGPQASADAAGRLALAMGFPTVDLGGWLSVLPAPFGFWAGILLAPLAVLALMSAIAPRWRAGITLLVVALLGFATAFLAVGIAVSFAQGTPVAIWPGAGLSLAWIGVTGAALVTLDTMLTMPRIRLLGATVAAVAVVVSAAPALLSFHLAGDERVLTNGPDSTLPAYVAAQAAGEQPIGTLVLTPQNDGGLAAEVVWGASETLGAQTTMMSTATNIHGSDITDLSVDLLSARDFDAAGELGAEGISYVLLATTPRADDRAVALNSAAVAALNQRDGFVHAGTTDRGELWSLQEDASARGSLTAGQHATARTVTTVQLVLLIAALLLSIPTRASRRAARAQSRIVGRAPDEPLVLPRHPDDAEMDAVAESRELHASDSASAAGSADGPAPEPTNEATDESEQEEKR